MYAARQLDRCVFWAGNGTVGRLGAGSRSEGGLWHGDGLTDTRPHSGELRSESFWCGCTVHDRSATAAAVAVVPPSPDAQHGVA